MGRIELGRWIVENELQFRHFLEIVNSLKIFNQKTVFLIIADDEIDNEEFIFILEYCFRSVFTFWWVLSDYYCPYSFYLYDGGVQGEYAVVL